MDTKVAKRLTPAAFEMAGARFRLAYVAFLKQMEAVTEIPVNQRSRYSDHPPWIGLINAARPLAESILTMKTIPAGQTKPLEMAVRLVLNAKRPPEDIVKWYTTNRNRIKLLNQAIAWPFKEEGVEDDQTFKIGPLTIHNTLGLSGNDLTAVKASIQKTIDLIKRLDVPHIEKVLYGDVHLVAKLKQNRTIAWYAIASDDIFVRPFKNVGVDEIQSLVHEFGHRYLRKFADQQPQMDWVRHHASLSRNQQKVEMPKPGDPLPVPLQGSKTIPIITKIDQGVKLELDTGGFIKWDSLYLLLKKKSEQAQYPTNYAATDSSEHFCESLGLRAVGQLKGIHLTAFQRIWEGKVMAEPTIQVEKVAERLATKFAASTYVQIDRAELEDWLNSLHFAAKPYLLPGKAGVYMLPVSDNVAIKLSSTIGTANDAMGRGEASMQLALVSRIVITPYGPLVLNKKAQDQSHFARTINWKTNWKTGVERMRDAYHKSAGFYDSLALIENRERYKKDLLARIEAIPNWRNHHIVSDFHARVTQNGILTTAQVELLAKAEKITVKTPLVPDEEFDVEKDELLFRMRELYKVARTKNDQWLMTFLTDLGQKLKRNVRLTEKQMSALDRNFERYNI